MDAATAIVAALEPIGLEELGTAALMDRVDEKFLIPRSMLAPFLEACAGSYRALELFGRRDGRYRTTYFDTPDLSMYHAHLTGRAVRRKLRVRTYLDTSATFLEVKQRDNRGRTAKSRVPVGHEHTQALQALQKLPTTLTRGLDHGALAPVVTSSFTRITLVQPGSAERLTIDSGIGFAAGSDLAVFPALVCIEVKQSRRGPSPALHALQWLRRRPGALSKYCVGVATTVPGVRIHRFKPLLNQLYRIERDDLPVAG